MVLRLIRDLPGDEFLLPPSPRGLHDTSNTGWADGVSTQLDTNNGCQDHTISPYAAMPFVLRALIAHGDTALRSVHAPDAAASTASRPAFVTIAIRPLCGTRRLGL